MEAATRGITANLWVGLFGALGGATNAYLCYARLPVPVEGNPAFAWHVIPAGAVHGGALALGAFALAALLSQQPLRLRLAAAPLVGWMAGFVSWIPLNRSAFDEPWSKSATWPFHEGWSGAILGPFMYFGLVTLLYYLCLVLFCGRARSLGAHVLYGGTAAFLGSLWWWSSMEPWYFSFLHGGIWGAFVGTGVWTAQRRGATIAASVA